MPIDDIKPTSPVRPYVGNEREKKRKQSGYGGGFQGGGYFQEPEQNTSDVTSFLGIPQDQLTEAVTDAIVSLMEEIDELRDRLRHTQSLEHMLSDSRDNHLDLPVLTHHALMREVTLMAGQVEKAQIKSTFAYLQIKNFAQIKDDFGLLAGETAMKETAEIIKQNLRQTDRIGTLGGDGFGIVFSLSDEHSAIKKIRLLCEKIEQGPILWDGHRLDLVVAFGVHPIHGDEKVQNIVMETDKDLHRRFVRR